ncbi:MAG: aminoglycoside phosphotransferase family protein [Phycisphaerales bacterium JB039]
MAAPVTTEEKLPTEDTLALGASLGPSIRDACGGRLSDIEWFRSTWQRGGAATGNATWTTPAGRAIPVMIKAPVGPVEFAWTSRLGRVDPDNGAWEAPADQTPPTPRVLAGAESLGPYDLGWLVVERLPGRPLAAAADRPALEALLRAAVRFQALAADAAPLTRPPDGPDWHSAIDLSRRVAAAGDIPDAQRWNNVLRRMQKCLPRLLEMWAARPVNAWCHGDLHAGNAMWRTGGDGARSVALIDLALIHSGHWSEDAIYLQRQYWGREELLAGLKPVGFVSKYRREMGLEVESGYGPLVRIRRALAAATAPAQLEVDSSTVYVAAALATLEELLPALAAL